jgi:hypothetical protein
MTMKATDKKQDEVFFVDRILDLPGILSKKSYTSLMSF